MTAYTRLRARVDNSEHRQSYLLANSRLQVRNFWSEAPPRLTDGFIHSLIQYSLSPCLLPAPKRSWAELQQRQAGRLTSTQYLRGPPAMLIHSDERNDHATDNALYSLSLQTHPASQRDYLTLGSESGKPVGQSICEIRACL